MVNFARRYYHRIRLTLWSVFHLPKKLFVADTNLFFPAWNWQVALLCKVPSTIIQNGRMTYEPIEREHFLGLLEKGDIFFDVGANIGYYSLLAAGHGAKKVFAFEILDEYASIAEKAFKLNHIDGEVIRCGVGKGDTPISFNDSLAGKSGRTPLALDDFSKKSGMYPDVIKMDIEGFEGEALQYATEILKRKPSIDISVHSKFLEEKGTSGEAVLSLLAGFGYRVQYEYGGTHFMKAK